MYLYLLQTKLYEYVNIFTSTFMCWLKVKETKYILQKVV